MVFLKEFFQKVTFQKNQQTTKKHENYPVCNELIHGLRYFSGSCIDNWTSKSCSCASGFVGERCAVQNMVHFMSGSFLHFGNYTEIQSLSIWVSTSGKSGVIVYTVSISDAFVWGN